MVFHSSAKFLMNRYFWVKAKICVWHWMGKSFTVVYLIAALASVGRKKPQMYEWRSSGYLWHVNNVYKDMIQHTSE